MIFESADAPVQPANDGVRIAESEIVAQSPGRRHFDRDAGDSPQHHRQLRGNGAIVHRNERDRREQNAE